MIKAGVMGWPVEHSLSPRLHGWWLSHYGIDGSYVRLPVPPENLEQALKDLPKQGFRGVNLTVPHKEAALKYMDYVEDQARRIGAINTVLVREDGTLEGRNTDVYGFAQNLFSAKYAVGGKPVVILGAGGAARAAIAALLSMGVGEIRIVNRTAERVNILAEAFGMAIKGFAWNDAGNALRDAELLVNATSLGMQRQPALEISLDTLPKNALVTDMVYTPLETGLLKQANVRGNRTLDGFGMLLHQACPAFAAFFGEEPEVIGGLRQFVLKEERGSS